jgi:hypothetical protein
LPISDLFLFFHLLRQCRPYGCPLFVRLLNLCINRLSSNLETDSIFCFTSLLLWSDSNRSLYSDQCAQAQHCHRAYNRNPSAKNGHLWNTCQKASALYKQQPYSDKYTGQAEAKDGHQDHAESDTAQGHRGQQQYQCRRARQQAAGYA